MATSRSNHLKLFPLKLLPSNMGKGKFNKIWLENSVFVLGWSMLKMTNLKPAALCKKTFKLGTLGIKALELHRKSEKHKATVKSHQQTPAITQYCSESTSGVSPKSSPNVTHSALTVLIPATLVSDWNERKKTSGNVNLKQVHIYCKWRVTNI